MQSMPPRACASRTPPGRPARRAACTRALQILLASLWSFGLLAPVARGQALPATEYHAKAAFLYNFTKYVEWPAGTFADARAPIRICVVGDAPFGRYLDAIQNRQAQGRPLIVARLIPALLPDACNMLFVSASEAPQLRQILAACSGRPVLTVGESERFADDGGMINLLIEDRRIKMEVNLAAASAHGLKLSSHLLRLAKQVGGRP